MKCQYFNQIVSGNICLLLVIKLCATYFIFTVSCPCNVIDDDSVRIVCIGPSTPPCLCSSQSCLVSYHFISLHLIYVNLQCNSPTYAGDGNVCGLDSDSDGFPDVGLDCDQPQCVQV